MSVIRPKPPEDPIDYDPAAVFAAGRVSRQAVESLTGRLDAVRAEVLESAVVDLPDRLLADYGTKRPESGLYAILRTARRIRDAVDRVVVIGDGGAIMGARAVFEACCHPFHNELLRGERGGRPRLSFGGLWFDNDSAQGLLDLVAPHGRPRGDDLLDRWAMLVVDTGGDELATAVTTRLFLVTLLEAVGGDVRRLAERVVPITGCSSRLVDLGPAFGCADAYAIPDGIGERFSALTAVGLLPASIAGSDVVRLLEGAAAMNRRFREAPVSGNPVLQCAAVSYVAEMESGLTVRGLASRSRQLEAMGLWYDLLRTGGVERAGQGPGRDALITNLVVGECRRDRLRVPPLGPIAAGRDEPDEFTGKTWSDLVAAAEAHDPVGNGRVGRPTADILLPRIDEHAIGQLLQMLMLATVVEGRLAGL